MSTNKQCLECSMNDGKRRMGCETDKLQREHEYLKKRNIELFTELEQVKKVANDLKGELDSMAKARDVDFPCRAKRKQCFHDAGICYHPVSPEECYRQGLTNLYTKESES